MTYEDRFALAESRGHDGAYTRIDDVHPVDIFVGLDDGCRSLMFMCPKVPPEGPSLAAIEVEARARQDGQWALVLRLLRPELKVLFSQLAQDIDAACRESKGDPGRAVVARLHRWQSLLSAGTRGLLDENALRGLCAELSFLTTEAVQAFGACAAVTAWVGPLDAPKDFVFETLEIEVKASHRQGREICISSLEQLELCEKQLRLWVLPVRLVAVDDPTPRSVAALVASARHAVEAEPSATAEFDRRLAAGGYEDRSEYTKIVAEVGAAACFDVREEFPRIERRNTPGAVVACEYRISLPALEAFKLNSWR